MIAAARLHGTAPVLHLSTLTENGQFSTERAETVLTDGAMQAALLTQIADTVRVKGFAGVDVDFEYLPGYLSGSYAAFLERLRRIFAAHRPLFVGGAGPKNLRRPAGTSL